MELLTIKQPVARAGLTAGRTWGEYSVSKQKKSSLFYILCWISEFIDMRVIYSNSSALVFTPLRTNPLSKSYIKLREGAKYLRPKPVSKRQCLIKNKKNIFIRFLMNHSKPSGNASNNL